MCRSKELGGRRCPAFSDPVKHAAYNKRRRESYAAKKSAVLSSQSVYNFAPLERVRDEMTTNEQVEEFKLEAEQFSRKIIPNYDELKKCEHHFDASVMDPTVVPPMYKAFMHYTGPGYRKIRSYVNDKTYASNDQQVFDTADLELNDKDTVWVKNVIASLDEGFSLVDKPVKPRTVYRGLKIDPYIKDENVDNWLGKHFPVGGVISQKHYMSTTADPATAADFGQAFDDEYNHDDKRSVVFEMMTREGAVLGYGTSHFKEGEREVLIPRNARFRVVSVDNNVDYTYKIKKLGERTYSDRTVKRTVIRLVDAEEGE